MTHDSLRRAVARLLRAGGAPASCLLVGLIVTGCATPPPPPEPPRNPDDVELTLNLPANGESCACDATPAEDRTFLERGVETLAAGEFVEAVQYFQRYRRMETSPVAQWEADIAIAYASMLPSSPFFDVDAANLAYTDLQAREPDGAKHHTIVLMQQALESFVLMDRHIEDLENRSRMLEDDLAKREEALRRLRELTLGQPGG